MHTSARPAGQHSEFYPHLGWQACTTFMPSICSCRKPEPSTSWIVDYVDFARLYVLHQAGAFFVTRAKSKHRCSSRLFGADGSLDRHHLRPDHLPGRLLHPSGLPRTSAAHPLQGPRVRQDAGLHHQQLLASGRHHLRALQKPTGRWNSSSSGSSSIFGSISSTARRRTR